MLYENILPAAKDLSRQERVYLALRMLESIPADKIDEYCELAIIDNAARISGCDVADLADRHSELTDDIAQDPDAFDDGFADQVRGDCRVAQMGVA